MGRQKADTTPATKEVGRRLRRRREALGWTLDDMIKVIDRSHLSAIENGKISPTVDTLYVLSEKLGIDLSELMGKGVHQRARELGEVEFAAEFAQMLPKLDEEARDAMEQLLACAVILAKKSEKLENE